MPEEKEKPVKSTTKDTRPAPGAAAPRTASRKKKVWKNVTVANAQNILRVNNIPGINAPYNTIQAAVAAASAGDIILVEGSPTSYDVGAFNLTKKLTIRGPGFFHLRRCGNGNAAALP